MIVYDIQHKIQTEYNTDGPTCLSMLFDETPEWFIQYFNTSRLSYGHISNILMKNRWYTGNLHRVTNKSVLPDMAIVKLRNSRSGKSHFAIKYHDAYYDPILGVVNIGDIKRYNMVVVSYMEILPPGYGVHMQNFH